MIKARGSDGSGRPIIFFGLSHENLSRLVADEPILIDLAELGFKGLPRVCIFAGKTEDDMAAQLKAGGVKLNPLEES